MVDLLQIHPSVVRLLFETYISAILMRSLRNHLFERRPFLGNETYNSGGKSVSLEGSWIFVKSNIGKSLYGFSHNEELLALGSQHVAIRYLPVCNDM